MSTPDAGVVLKKVEAWHSQTPEAALTRLGSAKIGLSKSEAVRRFAADGPNQLQQAKSIHPLQIFLRQFKSLIIWILIAAGIISGVLGEAADSAAILAIVILNAIIGFIQEYNAEKSIAALKKLTSPQAKVRRDDRVQSILASEIVAGDVLVLESGDLVAADARILRSAALKCVESALTGESVAVEKRADFIGQESLPLGDRQNMVFMGTSVAAGTGEALVVATAMKTELGRIAGLIEEAGANSETPLQEKLNSFGRVLVWATLGIVTLLFTLGALRRTPFFELFMTSISLAVAAVPEGLPAVVTIALSLGVSRMVRHRALVRRLPAVETLGSTTVICTDKTGTLTAGEMTVRALYVAGRLYEVTGEGYGPEGELRHDGKKKTVHTDPHLREHATSLLACNNAHLSQEEGQWKVIGDPTEGAMHVASLKAGVVKEQLEAELPKHGEIPFDSDRKRSTMIRKTPDGALRAFVNGAPDVLLARCAKLYTENGARPMTEEDRNEILAQNAAMADRALRVLGSAYRDLDPASSGEFTAHSVERDLVFVGLSGMYDPPRPEAKLAVSKCRSAGIRVVMITGDHPQTAQAVAKELGIASEKSRVMTGVELDAMSAEQLEKLAPEIAVYARVTAEHKLRIVQAWKAANAVVAMTGDGVNDAPAIKGADIGIAMGLSGTEVTKQAADMIITDDNFATIVSAVEQGRGIYDNIRKTLQYLLAGNTGELLLMTACVIVGLPAPLLPIHLLWINLVTDGLPALCLATDPIDADVMKRLPRGRKESITARGFFRTMLLTGTLTAGASLAVFVYALQTQTLEFARTQAFSVLVFSELTRSFGARSETKPIWRIPLLGNLNLILVVLISFGLQMASQEYAPLGRFLKTSSTSYSDVFILIAVGTIPFLILEITKLLWPTRTASGVAGQASATPNRPEY